MNLTYSKIFFLLGICIAFQGCRSCSFDSGNVWDSAVREKRRSLNSYLNIEYSYSVPVDHSLIRIRVGDEFGDPNSVYRKKYTDSFALKNDIEIRIQEQNKIKEEYGNDANYRDKELPELESFLELWRLNFIDYTKRKESQEVNQHLKKTKPNATKLIIELLDDYRPFLATIPYMIEGLQIDTLVIHISREGVDAKQYRDVIDSVFIGIIPSGVGVLCVSTPSDLFFPSDGVEWDTKNIKSLIIDAPNAYNLEFLDSFQNITTLEFWGFSQLQILESLTLPNLKSLSINWSNFNGKLNVNRKFINLETIVLHETPCMKDLEPSLFCLPLLNSVSLFNHQSQSGTRLKMYKSIQRVLKREKTSCMASWNSTLDSNRQKLLLKKIL